MPGDSVLFSDNLDQEKIGEFPSRWKLIRGNVEVAQLGGAPVIVFKAPTNTIVPVLPGNTLAADAVTLEFDLYFHLDGSNEAYMVNFGPAGEMDVRSGRVRIGAFSGAPASGPVKAGWHRVAVAIKGRAVKVYLDQDRVLNIPELKAAPTQLEFRALGHSAARGNPAAIRDVRIAIGSADLYDRLVKTGRFVTRGVHFEVGKSTLRPISLGVLNQVAAAMREHQDLALSVEGHTDSDGESAPNQTLSEQRAAAVVAQLTSMGIPADRLSPKGWGESKPVTGNSTTEAKANNRRVEFVVRP